MKLLTSVFITAAAVLLSGNAAAQDIVYFGRVTGSDQVGPVPGDWSVQIAVKRRTDEHVFCQTSSQGDLFACTAPLNAVVQILALRDGYQAQIYEVPPTSVQARVRPDLVLERITEQALMSMDAPAFERRLQLEADVARLVGRSDVFEVNYARYKGAAGKRPDLSEKAKQFESTASYRAIIKDPGNPRIPPSAMRHLVGTPDTVATPSEQLALYQIVQNETLTPSIRASAIKALAGAKDLSADLQPKYLDSLRKWSQAPDSILFGAATSGLAARGTANDQQDVARILQNSSPSQTVTAIESLQGTQLSPVTTRAVAGAARKTNAADVKLSSLRTLKGSTDPEAIKVAMQYTAATESAAVRLQAVTALGSIPLTAETSKLLSGLAKSDASAEVRAAAAAALIKK